MAVTEDGPQGRADVELRLPADSAYASVLRTTTAGLAARLDFTIDDIEDLRMAVAEAIALVLPEAGPGSDLVCRFWLAPAELTIALTVDVEQAAEPDYDSFAWQVLTTLASAAEVESDAGSFGVRLTMRSSVPGADR